MARSRTAGRALPVVPRDLDSALEAYFGDAGQAFAAALPARASELARRWSLTLGPALPGARTAFVAPCRRADGSEAVLRIGFPEQEPGGEAAALRSWGGEGAIRLLESDDSGRAMLLERCQPGAHLSESFPADRVIEIGARLLAGLWRPAAAGGDYLALSALAARRAAEAEERAERARGEFDAGLLAAGIALWRELPRAGEELLLHGDLHPRNVLAARRSPWLVIDPKPLVGDPAYEPVPLLLEAGGASPEQRGFGAEIARRVRRVSDLLDLEAGRVAGWGVARSVDWALFLAERGNAEGARRAAAAALAFAPLA